MNPLIIRTDASTKIGTGHVMRCLALAQRWQESGGMVYFVFATRNPELESRILNEGMNIVHHEMIPGSIEDSTQLIKIACERGADWVVVDGYHFDAEYQKMIKKAGLSLLFIDEYGHADHYYADIILNQNIYAEPSIYKNIESYTELLLGTKYALLRKEFLKFSDWKREIPKEAHNVLVTLGGGDPNNVTLKVIESLKNVNVDELRVIVVVGGVNSHYSELKQAIQGYQNFTIIDNSTDMPELMAWADVAISAGGSTCWELIFMRLPFMTIIMSENQFPIVTKLEEIGATISLGDYSGLQQPNITQSIKNLIDSQEKRILLIRNQKNIVNGNGSSEVVKMLI